MKFISLIALGLVTTSFVEPDFKVLENGDVVIVDSFGEGHVLCKESMKMPEQMSIITVTTITWMDDSCVECHARHAEIITEDGDVICLDELLELIQD